MSNRRKFLCYGAITVAHLIGLGVSSVTVARPLSPGLTGTLDTIRGVRVLRLWGADFERGYAHGTLLADDIVEFLEATVLDPHILPDPQHYEQQILPMVAEKMRFDPQRTAELDGMLRGIQAARAGRGIRLKRLNRNLTRADLEAVNTSATWYPPGCSSFSAWDSQTDGGVTITGRNLDFPVRGLRTRQLIMVYLEPGPGRKSWVSIGWPGLIGAYTAMNEDGVTISMHDVPGLPSTHQGKSVPRSYALRDAIERASAVSAVQDVRRVLLASPVLPGNNIHVSGPFSGQRNPAAVFEYDGDTSKDEGVTVRFAADENSAPLMNILLCTNHYRKRRNPQDCNRYATMKRFFEAPRPATSKIDVETARRVMRSVAGDDTLHSVVFLPNRREFYVSFASVTANATEHTPVRFALSELLAKR